MPTVVHPRFLKLLIPPNQLQPSIRIPYWFLQQLIVQMCRQHLQHFRRYTGNIFLVFRRWNNIDCANPVHIFNKPGTYIINLSFTTIHGCTGGAFPSDTVIVYPKPHASFDAYDSLPCTTNQLETFINLDDSAAKFQWFYGDGTIGYQ